MADILLLPRKKYGRKFLDLNQGFQEEKNRFNL